jgi:hypothetical protein
MIFCSKIKIILNKSKLKLKHSNGISVIKGMLKRNEKNVNQAYSIIDDKHSKV